MRKHTKPTDQLTADAPSSNLVKIRLTSFKFNIVYYEPLSENERINQVRNAIPDAECLIKKDKLTSEKNDNDIYKFKCKQNANFVCAYQPQT